MIVRKLALNLAIIAAMALVSLSTARAEALKLAVTTSFANSGLAEILLPQIEVDTGLVVQLLIVGTGQALALGAAGDVDAVLVHSRAAEDEFVAAGHATHRREIMYNDFILIGPSDDPANAGRAATGIEAFRAVALDQAAFISRGDDSGTHKMELSLWADAGLAPIEPWYREVGQGMGAALNTAAGMNAYILSDRATWLNFGNPADLRIVFEGDPALFNQYAYLPVNAAQHQHVQADAAARLEAWLTSETARGLINGYQIAGQQLFVFNATPE